MASVWVSEFDRVLVDAVGKVVLAPHYPTVVPTQVITIGGTTTQIANAFSGNTRFIQISCDGDCYFAIGANPAATAANDPLFSKETRFLGVERGHKIAILTKA